MRHATYPFAYPATAALTAFLLFWPAHELPKSKSVHSAAVPDPTLSKPDCTLPLSALTSQIPGDATFVFGDQFSDQCAVDQFAWQSFIALNWPAAPFDPNDAITITRGLPSTNQTLGDGTGDAPATWETYQPNSYVFAINSDGGLNPPAFGTEGWQAAAAAPGSCGGRAQKSVVLTAISKGVDEPAGLEQAFSGPLADQNGYYVRYEVLFNFDAFNYIVSNRLYDTTQQTPTKIKINFPAGSAQQTGTIMLKASWKVLSVSELSSGRFHTTKAFLFNPAISSRDGTKNIQASCTGPVTMGLVGLHIAHKTTSFPQWIWATFEQIDNAPDRGSSGAGKAWSFFNPSCTNCKPNAQSTCPNEIDPNGSKLCDWQPTIQHPGTATQVVRDTPISDDAPGPLINLDVQQKLKNLNPKSVWQFYQLVDAQWPLQPCGSVAPCQAGQIAIQCKFADFTCGPSQPTPGRLANTTMETYFQAQSSPKPERGTCLGCHGALATTNDGTASFSDFTFELENSHAPIANPKFRLK